MGNGVLEFKKDDLRSYARIIEVGTGKKLWRSRAIPPNFGPQIDVKDSKFKSMGAFITHIKSRTKNEPISFGDSFKERESVWNKFINWVIKLTS